MRKAIKAVERADRKLARKARPLAEKAAVKAIGEVSEIADQPPLYALSAAVIALGLVLRDRKLARTGVRMLATEALATQIKSSVKHRIDRSRPFVMHKKGYVARRGGTRGKELSSFPSGHTAGAVGLARAVMREYPDLALPSAAAAGSIAAIQVPRAAHFASDVIAGATIGLIAETVVDAALNAVDALFSPRSERAPRPRPGHVSSASEYSPRRIRTSPPSSPTP